ncbi:hypothetical protein RX916_24550, partial [Pseudomonas syringae pv. actinidiae]|nr:hypothetical protein [Pseudomonas syringae pv. actinidiae]
ALDSFAASLACCISNDLENQLLICCGLQPSMYFIRDGCPPNDHSALNRKEGAKQEPHFICYEPCRLR